MLAESTISRRRLLAAAAAGAAALAVAGRRLAAGETPPPSTGATGLELYGNFETMGVVADVPAGFTAAQIGEARCYVGDGGLWRPAHALVQVGTQPWVATSLFFLQPGTAYRVRVEFYDLSGKLIQTLEGQGRTRAEVALPEAEESAYVSPAGDDGGPGTREAPLRTLRAAFARAKPGTTIWVRGGAYYERG